MNKEGDDDGSRSEGGTPRVGADLPIDEKIRKRKNYNKRIYSVYFVQCRLHTLQPGINDVMSKTLVQLIQCKIMCFLSGGKLHRHVKYVFNGFVQYARAQEIHVGLYTVTVICVLYCTVLHLTAARTVLYCTTVRTHCTVQLYALTVLYTISY